MNSSWITALTERGARIEAGRVAGFGDAQREPPSIAPGTTLTALLSQGLILAAGEDAPEFLQGQLSNDITQVSRSRAQLAAYCTPKGRVLATVLLWRTEREYAVALPRELSEAVRRRLQMYVLRSKVKLVDGSDQFVVLGLGGTDATAVARSEFGLELSSAYDVAQSAGVTGIALPGGRVQISLDVGRGGETWDRLARSCAAAGEETWDARAIAAGVPAITTATQDAFTPHMLNLDLLGGVSFSKGCYTGQEIVARTQYLGQVKRRLARFATTARAAPGTGVFADGAQVGLVVNAARAEAGGFELLAVTQSQAAQGNVGGAALRLGAEGAELRPLSLPYPVPSTPEGG
jgi:tRNA-modifying protein YgfZ